MLYLYYYVHSNGSVMKHLSSAWRNTLDMNLLSIVTCWKITRLDGKILGFTDYDAVLHINGLEYLPSEGISSSAIESSSCNDMGSLNINNITANGFIKHSAVSKEDLESGKYDRATVEIFLVNYDNTNFEPIIIKKAYITSISIYDDIFVAELNENLGNIPIAKSFSSRCRACLGDRECSVNLNNGFIYHGTISEVIDNAGFKDLSLNNPKGYFNYGLVTFTSGNNAGITIDVVNYLPHSVRLLCATPYSLTVGDSYSIVAGCDKTFATCDQKFNNTVNFRGEPHVRSYVEIYGK